MDRTYTIAEAINITAAGWMCYAFQVNENYKAELRVSLDTIVRRHKIMCCFEHSNKSFWCFCPRICRGKKNCHRCELLERNWFSHKRASWRIMKIFSLEIWKSFHATHSHIELSSCLCESIDYETICSWLWTAWKWWIVEPFKRICAIYH